MGRIIVIEDDDIMRKAVETVLRKEGHEVMTAKDGKEAFELVDRGGYDLAITDLMMPYANGLEIVSRIRSRADSANVGIIIISSIGNEDSVLEGFNLGADDYLKKPIMAGELLIRIKKLLRR